MKKLTLLLLALISISAFSQVGVNTSTPTESLDVNGTLRVRDYANVKTLSTNDAFVVSNTEGVTKTVSLKDASKLLSSNPTGRLGTVLSDANGKFYIAPEINLVTNTDTEIAFPTGTASNYNVETINFDTELADNYDMFSNGVITIPADQGGVYFATIQIYCTYSLKDKNGTPINGTKGILIGLRDLSTNKWIARVRDDQFKTNEAGIITLFTYVNLQGGGTYRFATVTNKNAKDSDDSLFTVHGISTGSSGDGFATSAILKKVR